MVWRTALPGVFGERLPKGHGAGLKPAPQSHTGHGTLGWTHSCGSVRALADLVGGRRPAVDFVFLGAPERHGPSSYALKGSAPRERIEAG